MRAHRGHHLWPGGDTCFDEVDPPRARRTGELHLRRGGEGVQVGAGLVGAAGGDHAHPPVAGRSDGAPHGRADHLDDRDVIPLARIVQDRRARGVAGDDKKFDAMINQPVEALERILPGLGDRPRTVGGALGVAEIGDRLVGELVEDCARDRQTSEPGVEDANRVLTHHVRVVRDQCSRDSRESREER